MRKTLVAITLGLAALTAAACNGGGSSPSPSALPGDSIESMAPVESALPSDMLESPSDMPESPAAS